MQALQAQLPRLGQIDALPRRQQASVHRPEADEIALGHHLSQARPATGDAEPGHLQQCLGGRRRRPVAVDQLGAHTIHVVVAAHLGQPPVHLEAQPLGFDVVGGQMGVHR